MQHPKPWQIPRPRADFERAASMRAAGLSYGAIGRAFGVSRQRARIIAMQGGASD